MNNEKGLQKLTKKEDQKVIDSPEKIQALLKRNTVTVDDVSSITDEMRDTLGVLIQERLRNLQGEDRDEFIAKVFGILTDDTKRAMWENNHCNISVAISKLMRQNHRMPTKTEIAEHTGLSRQTIRIRPTNPSFKPQLIS